MSGTSRIGGYGGYSGTGGDSGRSAALARFCRGRKKGDVISGVFLRQEAEDLGWALLEGEELLAHLPAEGPRPAPGDRVFFRVASLTPEVVLHMLAADDPLARLSVILPSVPLAQEAVLYVAARDRLDALLEPVFRQDARLFADPDPERRKAAFINRAAADGSLFAAFAEALARSRALERLAAPAGLILFRPMPWLCAGLSRVEVSFWRSGEAAVFAGARLPSGDSLLLRGDMADGVLRYRLSVTGHGGGNGPVRFSPGRTAYAEYRGAEGRKPGAPATPPGRAADLVGRILALAADSGSMAVGRFSRKL